ncbi:MAG: peptidase S8 [Anaerolineaceae bacterium]|nr:peptidase S8 [Anaerolineaceae bacterium]MCB9102010.1 peptidase S8 [Anaerolineales bacterium]
MTKQSVLFLILILGLLWPASSLIKVQAASSGREPDAAPVLSQPPDIDPNPAALPDQALTAQDDVTTTAGHNLYFPFIANGFCTVPFVYNEVIRYNLNKINAPEAWLRCVQGEGVTVAVVDTGIDLDHPDLQANLVSGQSFVTGVSSPDDDEGHGTHVAGMVAGVGNNGGIIGVAPKAKLMPVKVLNSQGSGSTLAIALGIEWAADHGARVINLSLGGVNDSLTLQSAVDYALSKGVLLVAAGGNCGDASFAANGCSFQDQPVYPAADPDVVAVASTTSLDTQSSFSNEGSYIEVAAPGSSIFSTYPPGGYATLSGTSMASPHVAGLAALIWSQNPDWTNQDVRTRIRATAHDLGSSGWDSKFGYGRIDADAALDTHLTTAIPEFTAAPAVSAAGAAEAPYVPGEILLKLRPGLTINHVLEPARLAKYKVKVARTIDSLGVIQLSLTAGQERALLAELLNANGVTYAELNYIYTIN